MFSRSSSTALRQLSASASGRSGKMTQSHPLVRSFRSQPASSSSSAWTTMTAGVATLSLVVAATVLTTDEQQQQQQLWSLSSPKTALEDLLSYGSPTQEPGTGILFPQLCNGYYLVGCGVRIKYVFVKVYAVGTYMDPLAMSAVKKSKDPKDIQAALLNPAYPRTIRIVMNRGLSIEKYTAAILESLEPRMKGADLEKLEEFKRLNPPVDLVEGAEIEMTIRGDTLLYKNAVGGVGTIKSNVFTTAMLDTFYGDDPVSPTHLASVLEGIPKL